ncbi:MAG TPA: helix-turn-helix domain-containing protein [Gemmatimonadaceae bacterium]|nr:helix-turn-helix domain-containing protein [Gemmatimonadaceae bacterium]
MAESSVGESERAASTLGDIPFPATLSEITRAAVGAMLQHCRGNKSEAARRLGISRPRLQRILDAEPDASLADSNTTG